MYVEPSLVVDQIIEQAIQQLHNMNETATVELRITDVPAVPPACSHFVAITRSGTFLDDEQLTEPTLSVTLTYDAFIRLANGDYSPLQAHLDGKLRLNGDLDLGRRIYMRLRQPWLVFNHQQVRLKATAG